MIVIVDANILASASERPNIFEAQRSRTILDSIFNNSFHTIGLSNPLLLEYHENWSSYGKSWYFRMKKRGRIEDKKDVTNMTIRKGIIKLASRIFSPSSTKILEEVEKDIHLLELALQCDNFIISDENNARDRIKSLSGIDHKAIADLKVIIWVRPCECACEEFDLVKWIRENGQIRTIPDKHYLILRSLRNC